MIINPTLTEAHTRGFNIGKQDKSSGVSNYEPLNGSWEGKTTYQIIDDLVSEEDTTEFFHEVCDTFCDGYRAGNR